MNDDKATSIIDDKRDEPAVLMKAAARIETGNLNRRPGTSLQNEHLKPEAVTAFEKTVLNASSTSVNPAPLEMQTPDSKKSTVVDVQSTSISPPIHMNSGTSERANKPAMKSISFENKSQKLKTRQPKPKALTSKIGVVILDKGQNISPEPAIRALGEDKKICYVTADPKSDSAASAHRMGAEIVKLPSLNINPGRARNAGYRRLKALDPSIEFVQFLEPGFVLHADWFKYAASFMNRRPEVAMIDGHTRERLSEKSMLNMVKEISRRRPKGEVQSTVSSSFVRAEVFEAAGGFRGDIATNDTDDLCLRLRMRGQHIWRVETKMGINHSGKRDMKDWWREAKQNGYEYAHGVFLHGAPPERFRVLEQARALIWGGVFPIFVILAAFISAISVRFFAPLTNPFGVFFWILSFGFLVYFAKIFLIAIRYGPGQKSSWAYGALVTIGHFGEFLGVAKYHLDSRSDKPDAGKA